MKPCQRIGVCPFHKNRRQQHPHQQDEDEEAEEPDDSIDGSPISPASSHAIHDRLQQPQQQEQALENSTLDLQHASSIHHLDVGTAAIDTSGSSSPLDKSDHVLLSPSSNDFGVASGKTIDTSRLPLLSEPPIPRVSTSDLTPLQTNGISRSDTTSHSRAPRDTTSMPGITRKSTNASTPSLSGRAPRSLYRCLRAITVERFKATWHEEEHLRFLHGLELYGKGSWKEIAVHVGTRTPAQVQSHAQKVRRADCSRRSSSIALELGTYERPAVLRTRACVSSTFYARSKAGSTSAASMMYRLIACLRYVR